MYAISTHAASGGKPASNAAIILSHGDLFFNTLETSKPFGVRINDN
jgi:hypothetical protein